MKREDYDITESLKMQVEEQLEEQKKARKTGSGKIEGKRKSEPGRKTQTGSKSKAGKKQTASRKSGGKKPLSKKEYIKRKRRRRARKRFLMVLLLLLLIAAGVVATPQGRGMLYKVASSYILGNLNQDEETISEDAKEVVGRHEEYVSSFLIFGIEEIEGARNTDSMMLASINTKDHSIKLTSLMRDTYVDIPGYKSTKLNAAYAKGGAGLLIDTIEQNYQINLEGYASVNFESFEKIIDALGGVVIELGEEEAAYLNKTNYISNKEYRNVVPGVNLLNGNQALGYCRVRKVATLGGANNDYGRTLRQRRVLNAVFEKVKTMNVIEQLKFVNECLSYVTTNVSKTQLEDAMAAVVENNITTLDMLRIPADGMFSDPKSYNGVTYPLVLDWDANREVMYEFIFAEEEE